MIFAITMIYLSISVSAVGTFGSQAYVFVASNKTSTTSQSWQSLTIDSNNYQTLNNTSGSSQNKYMYLSFKTNQVPQDGYIIVITITLDTIADRDTITLLGVGQADTGTLPTSTSTAAKLGALQLNQEIIASTIADNGTGNTRLSVTFKAEQFANQYPIAAWSFSKNGTLNSVSCANVQLYESIEDAAGSGVTPEEMREVLSSWGEEELLPGIEESVQAGVTSGMEAALEDEKNQASSGAQGGLDELAGALSGVTNDITQAKQSFETLGSALSYSGTSASLTFPAMTVPFLGTISEAQPINLTQQIDNIMPPTLLLIIRCALSIGIVSYPIFELIHQLRKLLDKG